MARAHLRNTDVRLDYVNVQETHGTTSSEPVSAHDKKVLKLVLLGFGLLCMVQATLNVTLRLFLNNSTSDSKCENITAETDELQKKYSLLQTSHQTLSEETEELKQKVQNLTSFIDSYSKQGWIYFSGSFYLGSTQKLSWQDSRRYCQDRGADLIIINSVEEQNFASGFKGERHIGLSDVESEGHFKWVDGSPLTISFWNYGEPNNRHGVEDCVQLNFLDFNGWNDIFCENETLFICEIKNDK